MIEYKAYHKKSLGKPRRGHAARKRGKEGKGTPAGRDLRALLPAAAALLSLLLVVAAGTAAHSRLVRSRLFAVKTIDVNPCAHVTRDEVAGILNGAAAGNIWSLSTGEIGRRLRTHPFVRDVSVRKAFPDKLVVRIRERRPVAMVNLDALYYVDEQGDLFKRLTAYDSKGYPILTGFTREDLAAGDPVAKENLRRTIDLLQRAESGVLRQNVSEVHFDAQDGFTLVTRDAGLQLKIGTMEFPEAMQRVEAALPKLASLGREAGIVDLKTAGRIYVRPED